MRTEITPGQTSDYRGFDLVMADNLPEPSVLLADRGYDSDNVRKTMEARDVLPVIPMRKNRKLRVAVDRVLYRLRNLVFQPLHPLGFTDIHPVILGLPLVDGHIADAMLAAQIGDRNAVNAVRCSCSFRMPMICILSGWARVYLKLD